MSKRKRIEIDYKKIRGTNIVVDDFKIKTNIYFLSHFHSDHYNGLNKKFSTGIIYCSEITAKLVKSQFKISDKYIKPLSFGKRYSLSMSDIDSDKKCEYLLKKSFHITLIEANHCPGSAMFLFELPKNEIILHTGDFRYKDSFKKSETLLKAVNKVSLLYLDTTYCDPKYVFPQQNECIDYIIDKIKNYKNKLKNQKIVFIIGTYNLGKEKILIEIYKKLKIKSYVREKRYNILKLLGIKNFKFIFSPNKSEDLIEVIPLFHVSFKHLAVYKNYDKVIAFKPTGWSMQFKEIQRGNIIIHNVPYTEHSSFTELIDFVKFINAKEIIFTVINSMRGKKRMDKLIREYIK